MDYATERKRKIIINIFYYAIILGLFYFFMRYAFGIFLPFIVAVIIAAILQKPINTLTKRFRGKKGIISTILVLVFVGLVATFIIFVGAQMVSAVKSFASFLSQKIESLPDFINTIQEWFYKVIAFLPDSAENVIHNAIDSVVAKLSSFAASSEVSSATPNLPSFDFNSLSAPISGIWSIAKGIPSILISIVISIIATCFVAADYDTLKSFIIRQFPEKKRFALSKTKLIIRNSVFKLIKAYLLIILITFFEVTIGLNILSWLNIFHSEYILFIAFITAIVDVMPVLGTGTIIIPWALYSFITSDTPLGIGLLVLYAFITVARQFIEPKLVAGQLGLPPFVTIMGMYVGLKLFGVIGIFIVPFVLIILKLLNDDGVIHLWIPNPKARSVLDEESVNNEEKEGFFKSIFKKKK